MACSIGNNTNPTYMMAGGSRNSRMITSFSLRTLLNVLVLATGTASGGELDPDDTCKSSNLLTRPHGNNVCVKRGSDPGKRGAPCRVGSGTRRARRAANTQDVHCHTPDAA